MRFSNTINKIQFRALQHITPDRSGAMPSCWLRCAPTSHGIYYATYMYISSSFALLAGLSPHGVDAPLQWRHNGRDGISNHQHRDCLLNCLFRRRWKKTSKLRVTGLFEGNSPVHNGPVKPQSHRIVWFCNRTIVGEFIRQRLVARVFYDLIMQYWAAIVFRMVVRLIVRHAVRLYWTEKYQSRDQSLIIARPVVMICDWSYD